MLTVCGNCERDAPPYVRGRCRTCAAYWRRHGSEHRVPITTPRDRTGEPCADCGAAFDGRRLSGLLAAVAQWAIHARALSRVLSAVAVRPAAPGALCGVSDAHPAR
jgi:hypothetical protein